MPETTQTQKTHPLRPHRDSHGVLHANRPGAVSLLLCVGVCIREKVCDSANATEKNGMITELLVILYIVKYLCYSEQKCAHSVSAGWVDLFVHV